MTNAQEILSQIVDDLYAAKHWPRANTDREMLLCELEAGGLDADLADLAVRHGLAPDTVRRLLQSGLAEAMADPRRGLLYAALRPVFEQIAAVARPLLSVPEVEFCVFDDKHGTAASIQCDQAQLVAVNGALCSKVHVFASHFVAWKMRGKKEELPAATHQMAGLLLQALASQTNWGGEFNTELTKNETVGMKRLMEHSYRFVTAHEFGHLLLGEARHANISSDPVGIEVCADALALTLLADLNQDTNDMAACMEGVAFVLTLLRWTLLAKRCHDGRDAQPIARQFDLRLGAIPGGARKLELPIDVYGATCTAANCFFALLQAAVPA